MDFDTCAALDLFVSPTVTPDPAPADDPTSCSGAETNVRGSRTCTETTRTTSHGDVVESVGTGPYQGPFITTYYTGTSRVVTVVETTTVTARRGNRAATVSATDRVVSSTVEPLACWAWTAALRGGDGPQGPQDLATCDALGLYVA